jgi:hypothetical protein
MTELDICNDISTEMSNDNAAVKGDIDHLLETEVHSPASTPLRIRCRRNRKEKMRLRTGCGHTKGAPGLLRVRARCV